MLTKNVEKVDNGSSETPNSNKRKTIARIGEAATVLALSLSLAFCAGPKANSKATVYQAEPSEESAQSTEDTKRKIAQACENAENEASAFASKCEGGSKASCVMLETITTLYSGYCGWK